MTGKIEIYNNKMVFFILVFPFIKPLGINSRIFTLWQIFSIFCILLLWIKNFYISNFIKYLSVYHLILFCTTFFGPSGFSVGIQKIFIFPWCCLVYEIWCRRNPNIAITVTIDILLVTEILNIVLKNQYFVDGYLIGMRIVFPIIGFLGIYCSILAIYYKLKNYKFKSYLLILLIVYSITSENVSTGIVGLLILSIYIIVLKIKLLKPIINFLSPFNLLLIGGFINYGFVFLRIQNYFANFIENFLKESLTLNARTIIWDNAIIAIKNSPWFGYGVYGHYITTPWGQQLNYVHTQSLQLLLDGGIILFISFIFMIISIVKNINLCKSRYMVGITAIILFIYLIMMITEVGLHYTYTIAYIAISSNIKNIDQKLSINRLNIINKSQELDKIY